jgi:hypothetical protein
MELNPDSQMPEPATYTMFFYIYQRHLLAERIVRCRGHGCRLRRCKADKAEGRGSSNGQAPNSQGDHRVLPDIACSSRQRSYTDHTLWGDRLAIYSTAQPMILLRWYHSRCLWGYPRRGYQCLNVRLRLLRVTDEHSTGARPVRSWADCPAERADRFNGVVWTPTRRAWARYAEKVVATENTLHRRNTPTRSAASALTPAPLRRRTLDPQSRYRPTSLM